jgi:hypothetical protein
LKYVGLVQWSTAGGNIRLEMLGEDQAVHQVEVSSECAGALAAALAAELEKRNAQGKDQQFIRPTGMQTAVSDHGDPMIVMSLKGGVELPLVFKPESLDVLISELEGLRRHLQPGSGSQIRWR